MFSLSLFLPARSYRILPSKMTVNALNGINSNQINIMCVFFCVRKNKTTGRERLAWKQRGGESKITKTPIDDTHRDAMQPTATNRLSTDAISRKFDKRRDSRRHTHTWRTKKKKKTNEKNVCCRTRTNAHFYTERTLLVLNKRNKISLHWYKHGELTCTGRWASEAVAAAAENKGQVDFL